MGGDRLLVVNADDFGITPEVSAGILECASAGLVRSTTVLANIAADDEITLLKEAGLASGLHFNITRGVPLAIWPPDLLRDGGVFDRDRAGGYPADLIEDELYAQWDFMTSRGINPTHLDSHHHVHALPAVLPVIVKFALWRGIPVRPSTPSVRAYLQRYGIAHPSAFSADFFRKNDISRISFLSILDGSTSPSLEIMCHPGRNTELLEKTSSYAGEREIELSVLADPGLVGEVLGRGWRLGCYGDIRDA